jgi:hypothetical protein
MSSKLNVLSSITLPPVTGNEARSLHTVVEDAEGNIYYSDEFNHCVASLDPYGNVRWSRSGKGQEAGHFFYPKGIALGWISEGGVLVQCLGVCDSWNRRIQFFQLDGNPISSWKSAGNLEFTDVADIRFLTPDERKDPKAGSWLVLDRGNHRLCRIGVNGELQSQIGRCFDPLLEVDWAARIASRSDNGNGKVYSSSEVFDPLFYADRILGRSEEALFLWEPLSRHLKQVVGGNLYTIHMAAPHMGEWIVADAGGLISWSRSSEMLSFHNCLGSHVGEVRVQGKPVFSDTSYVRVWMQHRSELRQIECDVALKSGRVAEVTGRYPLLGSTTEKQISFVLGSRGQWASVIADLQTIANLLLAEARTSLELVGATAADAAEVQRVRIGIGQIQTDLSKASAKLTLAIGGLSALLLPNLRVDPASGAQPFGTVPAARQDVISYLAMLQDYSARLQKHLDDILFWRWSVQADRLRESERSEHARLQQLEDKLQILLGALDRANESLLPVSETAHVSANRPARLAQGFLHEVDRIFVGDPLTNRPGHPNHLTRTSDGHIFVTGWNQVLHLDPKGKILERLERLDGEAGMLQSPIGIAADGSDRVWVTDFASGRLIVYDAGTRSFAPLDLSSEETKPLRSPHGLCYRPDGWILVADTANSRILAVSKTGQTRVLASRSARESSRFWLPIGVFVDPSDNTGAFWVVDHRNHLLQEFDGEGKSISEIGGCGIGKGNLVLPECASFLTGGSLLVSQHRFNPVVKLFTREGKELERCRVDYSPAGILAHDGFILIANVGGSDIRVYERR